MLRVEIAPQPKSFKSKVGQPGSWALEELIGKPSKRTSGKPCKKAANRKQDIPTDKFPPYWTKVLDEMMQAYGGICAYSCFRIHPVTGHRSVDHFAAKSTHWKEIYRWRNYRLASGRLNARKKDFSTVLDPFEIKDGWFQLELTGFQVVPDRSLDQSVQNQIEDTIRILKLNEWKMLEERERDAVRYWNDGLPLKILEEESPFVARELRRQHRLLPQDLTPRTPNAQE